MVNGNAEIQSPLILCLHQVMDDVQWGVEQLVYRFKRGHDEEENTQDDSVAERLCGTMAALIECIGTLETRGQWRMANSLPITHNHSQTAAHQHGPEMPADGFQGQGKNCECPALVGADICFAVYLNRPPRWHTTPWQKCAR